MKPTALLTTLLLTAVPLLADADPKADVTAALKKLADAPNYSWTSTTESAGGGGGGGGGGQFRAGPTQGKAQKDGLIWIATTFGDNTRESLIKAGKVATKTDEGWKSAEELRAAREANQGGGGGQGRRGLGGGRMFENFKAPAAQAQEFIEKSKELKKVDDAFVADLNEEAIKSQLTFGGGGRRDDGSERPAPTNMKGTMKVWLKDGAVAKYQVNVMGTVPGRDGGDREINRTTTVEIKDVGSTKIEAPDEAKAKVSS
jgi:hypothetical protein